MLKVMVSIAVGGWLLGPQVASAGETPLEILAFHAECPFGVCEFCVDDPVSFVLVYEGTPRLFSYDWDGDGSFDEDSPTPVGSHAYDTVLIDFFPRARIRAEGQEDTYTHIPAMRVINCGPPTPVITVSGPTTREVGQAGTYSGLAFNCSPSATGWSWSASGGGVITGNTSSSEVSITWSTSGLKTVTASNSACGTATGSLNVTVIGPSIAIAGPTIRLVDQPGVYSASAEDCSPSTNGWRWSATGGGVLTGNTSSNAVAITWGTAGDKTVTASNNACGGAEGVLDVTVIDDGDGVTADFDYSPENPQAGEPVTFDASASTGDIGSYFWVFGDGSATSGLVVSHTFAEEGEYVVFLTVAEPGCNNPQCEDTVSQTVTVSGSATIFFDGFESGDTSAWVPR